MNGYQKNFTFLFRLIGFGFVVYMVIAFSGLVYRATAKTEPDLTAHLFFGIEYLAIGVLLILLAKPLGALLGRDIE